LWSVHDFKAYNIFACWIVHGELACPICGSDTYCFHLIHGGNISYFDYHRHLLPRNHMFRQQKNAFKKDNIVTKGPPKHLSGAQIIHMMEKLTPNPERPGYFEGYGETHNWTHKCGLWELPYMPALILMHNIDVMHRWITSKYFTLLCIFLSTLLLIIYPLQAASDKLATQFINNMFNSSGGGSNNNNAYV
jgi:hypothetical protein